MTKYTHLLVIVLGLVVVFLIVCYFISGNMFLLLFAELLGVSNIIISPLPLYSAMKSEFVFCELLVLFNLPIIFVRFGNDIISPSDTIMFVALYLVLSNISQMCLLIVSFYLRYNLEYRGNSDA